MKIYIFEYINQLTNSYHTEGGLVVIAKDKRRAKQIIAMDDFIDISEDEWKKVKVMELAKDYKEECIIFPDAGCC